VLGIHRGTTILWASASLLLGNVLLAGDQQTTQFLSNFQQVNESLSRGAQPSDDGFRELAKQGVKTILDLRGGAGRSSHEAEIVRSLGMKYINVPLDGYQAPTADEVSKVMAVLNDTSAGKVFVHCRRGADRTGTVLAMYRIEHDHWTNQQALEEAKSMKMASSEKLMQKFVMGFSPVVAASPEAALAR
jgi:tyrosine-protein phosphatase SIW14